MLKLALLMLLLVSSNAISIPGLTPEKSWDLDGYIKYMGTGYFPQDGDNALDHLLHNRINFEYRAAPSLRFNLGMRNRLFAGDSAQIPGYSDLIELDPGYWDLSYNWLDNGSVIGNTQLDRLYINWKLDKNWQLRAGRFRINWAMATLWNPNDIFNAYSIYDFDYEERSGADAVMISRKLGFASSIDLVYNPNQDSDLTSYAARYLFNTASWDGQLLVGKSGFDQMIGVGFAGDLYGAGFRGEFSYFDPLYEQWPITPEEQLGKTKAPVNSAIVSWGDQIFEPESQSLSATSVISVEMDYSFVGSRNMMVKAALLHISEPTEVDSALLYLNLPLTARTLSFTHWTYYLDMGFDISSLSRLIFATSYYDDGSYFVGVSGSYSLADDWQLLMVLQNFGGTEASLFGQTPSTLAFAQLKWSF